jgi:hypothetical protein
MRQSTQQITRHLCLPHTECSSNYEISAPTTYQMIRNGKPFCLLQPQSFIIRRAHKTAINVMSDSMEQLCSHWIDFHKIWYLSVFKKSVGKIKVSLKSDKNKRYFTWRPIHIYPRIIISRSVFLRIRNVSDKSCTENQNVHFRFNNFLRKSRRIWHNAEKYGRACMS